MGRTCVLIVIVFLKVVFVSAGDYPEFMDEDDVRTMGLGRNPYNPNPHHRAPHIQHAVTGRYTSHPVGYNLDPYGNFEHPDNLPSNALPLHRVPLNRNVQRGDPTDQDIVAMVADAQVEQPFPEDNGVPNPNDARELNELPNRLSQAKKWGEFRSLLAEEGNQFAPGEVMKNWEEDAHKWATYSKHLVVRAEHEKNKNLAIQRQGATPAPAGKPNYGMSPYWSEDTVAEKLPEDKVQETWWLNTRRLGYSPYDEETYDNIQSRRDPSMPPVYYKGKGQQDDYEDYGGAIPPSALGKPIGRSKDTEFFTPGNGANHLAELDYGTFKNGDLEKFMPPYPSVSGPGPDGPSHPPGMTRSKSRKMPGPGSEKDYPDGYKPAGSMPGGFPNYMDPGPDPAFTGGNYPQASKQMRSRPPPGMKMGNIPRPPTVPQPGAMAQKSLSVHDALRMGVDKMPGPGSEKEFPDGFRPGSRMPGGNGPGPGGFPGSRMPGGNGPGPGGFPGSRMPGGNGPGPGGFPGSRMPGGNGPGPGGFGGGGGGGGGGSGPPRGPRPMRGKNGHYSEEGGSAPDYGPPQNHPPQFQQGPNLPGMNPGQRPPRNRGRGRNAKGPKAQAGIPTGKLLLSLANKKLAALDNEDQINNATREMQRTTTERQLTRDEMLNNLRQFDDFRAPIRWVKFNSPDTRDGLARVTDQKTHQNQQFIIEGELYVPVVDESMSRLGWTTEAIVEISTTESPKFNDEAAIRVLMRSMNITLTDERDWLVYETVMGSRVLHEKECDGENCQSRCNRVGCDTVCRGDTCASGCVGPNCNSLCIGPGCNSMCIGDHCRAKCDGVSCEVRCYGKECETDCKSLSCMKVKNGNFRGGSNKTWNQMYPQYGMDYGPENGMRQGPGDYEARQNDYYD